MIVIYHYSWYYYIILYCIILFLRLWILSLLFYFLFLIYCYCYYWLFSIIIIVMIFVFIMINITTLLSAIIVIIITVADRLLTWCLALAQTRWCTSRASSCESGCCSGSSARLRWPCSTLPPRDCHSSLRPKVLLRQRVVQLCAVRCLLRLWRVRGVAALLS